VLELVDAALDEIAGAVDFLIVTTPRRSLARWNDRLGVGLPDQFDQPLRVVSAVGQNMAAFLPGDELSGCPDIVPLSRRQQQADRPPGTFDRQIDLRAQAAARAPERLILSPLFAPAAC